jgi:MoxR-like ATPase
LRLRIGYPDRKIEKDVLTQHRGGEPVDTLTSVLTREELITMQGEVRQIRVDDSLNDYVMDVVDATRTREDVFLGVSTRGALMLYRTAQAYAYVEGREYVTPDDVKRLAAPVLAHRVLSKNYRQTGRIDAGEVVVQEILDATPVPT